MGRAPCCDKNGLKKGPWTPEEDQKLIDYIQKHGSGNWRILPKNAGLQRCGKSCRLRWTNYLRPDIKRGRLSFEEEETIIQLHSILGNKWSAIAARLPGRTDNEIKNYWNTHIRKKLLRMGIDPVTHSPRLDLLDLSSILNSSLYNSSHMNLSRLLGVQSLVNPEILRLASSLTSTQHSENQPSLVPQNVQENQLCNQQQLIQNQQIIQQNQALFQDVQNVQQWPSDMSNFGAQNSHLDDQWQTSVSQDCAPLASCSYYGPTEQATLMDNPLSETSTFYSNSNYSNQNLNLASVLSTPSSSPTPLNSSSTYINSSAEDEMESYCSNIMKFELPDILDVNDFIL